MSFSIVLLIRKLRPFLLTFGVVGWFLFRVYYYFFVLGGNRNCDATTTTMNNNNDISLLNGVLYCLEQIHRSVLVAMDFVDNTTEQYGAVVSVFRSMLGFGWLLLEDYLGIALFITVWNLVYRCYHYRVAEVKDTLIDTVFDWSLRYNFPPQVNAVLRKEMPEYERGFDETIGKSPKRILRDTLPKNGLPCGEIINELQQCASKENEAWLDGKVSGTVYPSASADTAATSSGGTNGSSANHANGGTTTNGSSLAISATNAGDNTMKDHTHLMNKVYSIYSWSNPLHHGYWPKLNQCESEVIAITGRMLHAPTRRQNNNSAGGNDDDASCYSLMDTPLGCVTSGGTESILLAIYAHFIYYGKQRGIAHPELICGTTAHAAVDKACELFGIRRVVVDCNKYHSDNDDNNGYDHYDESYGNYPKSQKTYQLSPAAVDRHITSNTIMIYASAPCYPQGVIDPVGTLSHLALEYDIGLHVDCCLGGFVLPFMDHENQLPPRLRKYDFRSRGVTSMSIDTHKYGFASKGTSVVLYRNKELRHAQYFCYPQWTGGLYATPTIAGSRSGGLVVSAWAALLSIGESGYRRHVSRIVTATRTIANRISAIPGIIVMTHVPTMVVCFSYRHNNHNDNNVAMAKDNELMDVYRVHDEMSKKGWKLNSLQNPPSVHVCVTMNIVPKVDEFVEDLKGSVRKIQKEIEQEENEQLLANNKEKKKSTKQNSTAGIYGTAGTLPDGPVKHILRVFMDSALSP